MSRPGHPLRAAAALALLVPVHSGAQQTPAATPAPVSAIAPANRSVLSPSARQPTVLPEGQRNPFGAPAVPVEAEQEAVATETEEAKLRRILGTMRVTGLSGSPGSYSLVVGSLVLREGQPVPRLFADQAEELKVDSVTEKEAVLSFVERTSGVPPRVISLRFDLDPRVRSVLPGELFQAMVPVDPKGNIQLADVEPDTAKEIEKGLKEQEFEGLVERRFKLMGAPIFPRGDESSPQQP
jgi:hypothetical protein